jgi:hypothetical protein
MTRLKNSNSDDEDDDGRSDRISDRQSNLGSQ